ncbi:hypothetical protein ACFVDQ_02860 [Streptomyces sp. NPDC057684]|uniref:hypothetical protein n=1 Tax=unclassified Streptomyces TaxID=2593676 RepID=UPI0036AD9B7E
MARPNTSWEGSDPCVGDALVEFINDLDQAVRDHGKTTQVWQWWDPNDRTEYVVPVGPGHRAPRRPAGAE